MPLSWSYLKLLIKQNVAAFAILAALLLTTGLAAVAEARTINSRTEATFQLETQNIENSIRSRLNLYSSTLRSTQAFFKSKKAVTRVEFKNFVQATNITHFYSGTVVMEYVHRIDAGDKEDFTAQVRRDFSQDAEGYPNFNIHPKTDTPKSYVVDYSEPFQPLDPHFGFDYNTDSIWSTVLQKAQDDDSQAATGIYNLPETNPPNPSFAIFAPVYDADQPAIATVDRQAAIEGFIAIIIPVKDLFNGVLNQNNPKIDMGFTVYDSKDGPQSLLRYPTNANSIDSKSLRKSSKIRLAQRDWIINFEAKPDIGLSWIESWSVFIVLSFGGLFSGLIFAILLSLNLAKSRAVKLAEEMTYEIEASRRILEQEKARAEALLASIGEGIVAINRKGKITLVNQAATEMLGWSSAEMIGKRWGFDLPGITGNDGKPILKTKLPFAVAMRKTAYKFQRLVYITKDGRKLSIASTASPVVTNQEVIGSVLVFRDITQEMSLDAAKTEFISLAAHQLRSPLAALSWNLEMLTDLVNPEESQQSELLIDVNQAVQKMIGLVSSLLNISRLDLGSFLPTPKKFNLTSLCHQLINSKQTALKTNNLTLKTTFDHVSEVNLDPLQVSLIVEAILSNSIAYSTPGGVINLTVSLHPQTQTVPADSDTWLLTIQDSGIGIPINQQDQIFTKLFRASNVQQQSGGNGLSLYLIKGLVERMGGEIWFKSKLNHGTTFYVRLPLVATPVSGQKVL